MNIAAIVTVLLSGISFFSPRPLCQIDGKEPSVECKKEIENDRHWKKQTSGAGLLIGVAVILKKSIDYMKGPTEKQENEGDNRPYKWSGIGSLDGEGFLRGSRPESFIDQKYAEKMHLVQKRKSALLNAPVKVENIHARGNLKGGEFFLKDSKDKRVKRMFRTIESLAALANEHHKSENFENGQLKANRKNRITRLVTNEFAFYTADSPLIIDEFYELLTQIELMASELSPNLVLVLASFPVLRHGTVYNLVIHVQCGQNPTISSFAKTLESNVDCSYEGRRRRNSDYSHLLDEYEASSVPSISRHHYTISMNSVILVRTLGGAGFYDVIEVCLDHKRRIGGMNLENELREQIQSQDYPVIIEQVSHVVTSASVEQHPENFVGTHVMHADQATARFAPGQKRRHQLILKEKLARLAQQTASSLGPDAPILNLKLCEDDEGICFSNPDFGFEIVLNFLRPHLLDRLPERFVKKIWSKD